MVGSYVISGVSVGISVGSCVVSSSVTFDGGGTGLRVIFDACAMEGGEVPACATEEGGEVPSFASEAEGAALVAGVDFTVGADVVIVMSSKSGAVGESVRPSPSGTDGEGVVLTVGLVVFGLGVGLSVAPFTGAGVGAEVVGADVVGADVVGAEVVGADVTGEEVVGGEVVGASESGVIGNPVHSFIVWMQGALQVVHSSLDVSAAQSMAQP